MNCCTGDCNQGRDCPTRAKVARIGRKDYTREELPPMRWRSQLRRLATWVVYGIIGTVWLAYLIAVVRWAHA